MGIHSSAVCCLGGVGLCLRYSLVDFSPENMGLLVKDQQDKMTC